MIEFEFTPIHQAIAVAVLLFVLLIISISMRRLRTGISELKEIKQAPSRKSPWEMNPEELEEVQKTLKRDARLTPARETATKSPAPKPPAPKPPSANKFTLAAPLDPAQERIAKKNQKWFDQRAEDGTPKLDVVDPPPPPPAVTVVEGFTIPCDKCSSRNPIQCAPTGNLRLGPGPVNPLQQGLGKGCPYCNGKGYIVIQKG